jgi:hypothetical protein
MMTKSNASSRLIVTSGLRDRHRDIIAHPEARIGSYGVPSKIGVTRLLHDRESTASAKLETPAPTSKYVAILRRSRTSSVQTGS